MQYSSTRRASVPRRAALSESGHGIAGEDAPWYSYICDACGAGFGFRRAYDDEDSDDDRAIACLQENPKKPGTACNLRYEAYKSATTVAEFLEKGGTPADLTHDFGKGFVWYVDDGRRPRGNQLPN